MRFKSQHPLRWTPRYSLGTVHGLSDPIGIYPVFAYLPSIALSSFHTSSSSSLLSPWSLPTTLPRLPDSTHSLQNSSQSARDLYNNHTALRNPLYRSFSTSTNNDNPTILSSSIPNSSSTPSSSSSSPSSFTFRSLGLTTMEWENRLRQIDIHQPTNTQILALPSILAKTNNIVLQAETGSGKTLTYLLPILSELHQRIQNLFPLSDNSTAVSSVTTLPKFTSQLLAVGIIVVPTTELVNQVANVAKSLVPEYSNYIHIGYGNYGVTKRMNSGLIITTPKCLRENINSIHLSRLQYFVLDEADALLTGDHKKELVDHILSKFKLLLPEQRPIHIFCCATLPSRSSTGVAAFLEKYYPEPGTKRITSQGSHRLLPRLSQQFLQIDSQLPLTMFEEEQIERWNSKVKQLANEFNIEVQQMIQQHSNTTTPEYKFIPKATDETKINNEPNFVDTVKMNSKSLATVEEEMDEDDDDDNYDSIEKSMEGRIAEEKLLRMQADDKRYQNKLSVLRKEAVIEALLLPAKLQGLNIDNPVRSTESVVQLPSSSSSSSSSANEEKKSRRHNSAVLGLLTDEQPPNERRVRGAERRAKESAEIKLPVDRSSPLSLTSPQVTVDSISMDTTKPKLSVEPLKFPETPRARLTLEQCALIPPTLIFVNSATSAENLRTVLNDRCPSIRTAVVHGEVNETARTARLMDFTNGRIRILIATDLAARGLDTSHVAHVIQAEFALDAISYIHRVGRTARAGRKGIVTNLIVRHNLDFVDALIHANDNNESLDSFSRRGSFRRRVRKANLSSIEDEILKVTLGMEKK